jgi:NAD(P)-dependent dehydrogenase (short-subunit alcohol dehydrogenase family)
MGSDLKGAVITGASRGIGLCIAQSLLREGFQLVIADIEPLSDKGRSLLSAFGDNFFYIRTDVSDEGSVKAMAEFAGDKLSSLNLLVNNAAASFTCPPQELPFDQWQRVIGTNLGGTFLCSKYCAQRLKQDGGAIVNIASTRAFMSEPNTEAYSASKAAIVGLTHSMALSLGPSVRVNCISPGWIDTSQYRDTAPESLSPQDHNQHPCGRVGQPDDIAEMIVYLGSEKAKFITGQNFTIDGGMTKKMMYV